MTDNNKPDFTGKRIWMYWPGEKAIQLHENVEQGFMACGLPKDREVGDLNEIMNVRGGLDAALKEAYGAGRRIADGEKLLREFANLMQIGDFVIARKEFDQIVGIGIITGDYYYDAVRPRFRHCRKVEWIDTKVRSFPAELKHSGKWHRVTLIDLPYRKIAEQIISSACEGKDVQDSSSCLQSISAKSTSYRHSQNSISNKTHAAFMNAARHYQESIVRQWAKELGGVCIWDERPRHGVWLKEEYALKGLVFYEGFRQEIMEMYRAERTKIGINLLNNALRSEHIPYNLFFPMMRGQNKEATRDFFNELLNTDTINEVLEVRIEFAPQPKSDYLNDGTSFDAFVLYQHKDGSKGGIGIEVKYTEREYQIGKTEYRSTHDKYGKVKLSEHYARATDKSGYYVSGCEKELVSDNLRQIWRNHILGASMMIYGDIQHFASMTIFPNLNPHFHEVSKEYCKLLTEKGLKSFFVFTYEKLFETLTHHFQTQSQKEWIEYLRKRYLFKV